MDLRQMLKRLLELEDGLTGWEVEFIESLSNWKGDFTKKQADCLEKIYHEHFSD